MKIVDDFLKFDIERLRLVVKCAYPKVTEIHVHPNCLYLMREAVTVENKIYTDAGGYSEKIISFEGVRVVPDMRVDFGDAEIYV